MLALDFSQGAHSKTRPKIAHLFFSLKLLTPSTSMSEGIAFGSRLLRPDMWYIARASIASVRFGLNLALSVVMDMTLKMVL